MGHPVCLDRDPYLFSLTGTKFKAGQILGKLSVTNQVLAIGANCYKGYLLAIWMFLRDNGLPSYKFDFKMTG